MDTMTTWRRTLAAFGLGAALFTTVPVWGQDLNTLLVGFITDLRNGTVTVSTAYVIGAATTSGIRLDLTAGGNLAVREGDDTANAAVIAKDFYPSAFISMGTTRPTITVDSATTFVATASYLVLACTGAEQINTITGGAAGVVLYLENSDTDCTLDDDDTATATDAIDLTGTNTDDVGAVNKVVVLIYNGTHWLQVAESDN